VQIARFNRRITMLLCKNGRSGGIRTHDPYTPSIVRYQAALRSGQGWL
jgi:hypothetical protein